MAHSKSNYTAAADVFRRLERRRADRHAADFLPYRLGRTGANRNRPGAGDAVWRGTRGRQDGFHHASRGRCPTVDADASRSGVQRGNAGPGAVGPAVSRLSGIDLDTVRYRRLTAEHAERIDQAMHTLEPLAERLAFVRPPFDLANVAASVPTPSALTCCLLDYIQRIAPPGQHADKRVAVNATMDYLRQFADAGVAVLVVAAVGRTKDKQGPHVLCGRRLEPGFIPRIVANWNSGPTMPLSWCRPKRAGIMAP